MINLVIPKGSNLTSPSYYLEFEFTTDLGNSYWLPVFAAINSEEAENLDFAIRLAIKEQWRLTSSIRPMCIAGPMGLITAKPIAERIKVYEHRPEVAFDLHLCTSQNTRIFSELSVTEHEKAYGDTPVLWSDHCFSLKARCLLALADYADDLLFLRVINPTEGDHVYVRLEIDTDAVQGMSLTEGVWKQSDVSGYFIRTDTPHGDSGRRHVHVAHRKHIRTKTKQVSWNDDGTRHDVKSFDNAFVGMEVAKRIARRILGLPDDVILENRQLERSLLTEGIVENIPNDQLIDIIASAPEDAATKKGTTAKSVSTKSSMESGQEK